MHAPATEMSRTVDLARSERLGIGSSQIKDYAIFISAVDLVQFINSARTDKFIHAPPRDRFSFRNHFGGQALGYFNYFAWLAGYLFK